MPSYKLIYFDARGKAEPARLCFKQAGVEFEDVRVAMEEWLNIKSDQPLNSLPVLEVDGKKVCQSMAIARYLAREFGLFGSNNLEGLLIDEMLETLADLSNKHLVPMMFEQDDTKNASRMKEFKETLSVPFFDLIEKRLKENNGGNGFYVGENVTLADLVLFNLTDILRATMTAADPTGGRPLIDGLYKRVATLPKIAAWIKERPATDH